MPRKLPQPHPYYLEKAGTSRTADGGLTPTAGRLPPLDEILASSSSSPLTELASLLEETIAAAGFSSAADTASSGHYVRAAKKVAERGVGYLDTEIKRLEGLLSGAQTLSPQKRTLFMVRSNILRAFVETGVGGGAGAAAGGETEL